MTEPFSQQTQATAGQQGSAAPPGHVTFDGRHPKLLDHRGHALEITAGHVDVFAVGVAEGNAAGARHHLFRVESGEIILDLQDGFSRSGLQIRVVAVGSPGAGARLVPRADIASFDPVATWIRQLARLITGSNPSWDMLEVATDGDAAVPPGERRRGPARSIVWVSLASGTAKPMGLDPVIARRWPAIAADFGDVDRGGANGMQRGRQRGRAGSGFAVARHRSISSRCRQLCPRLHRPRRRPGGAAPRASQRIDDRADGGILRSPCRCGRAAFRPCREWRPTRRIPCSAHAASLRKRSARRSPPLPSRPWRNTDFPASSRSPAPRGCAFAARCCAASGGKTTAVRWWPGTARRGIRSRSFAAAAAAM